MPYLIHCQKRLDILLVILFISIFSGIVTELYYFSTLGRVV